MTDRRFDRVAIRAEGGLAHVAARDEVTDALVRPAAEAEAAEVKSDREAIKSLANSFSDQARMRLCRRPVR